MNAFALALARRDTPRARPARWRVVRPARSAPRCLPSRSTVCEDLQHCLQNTSLHTLVLEVGDTNYVIATGERRHMEGLAKSVDLMITRAVPPRSHLHRQVHQLILGHTDVSLAVLTADHTRSIGLNPIPIF